MTGDCEDFVASFVARCRARRRRERLVDLIYSTIIGLCIAALVAVVMSGAGR